LSTMDTSAVTSDDPASVIWVARHGERADVDPEWERTAERPHDPPLTPMGRLQADATARVLVDERIDVVYSSPFLRCLETAAAVAKLRGLRIRVEPGLAELLNPRWFTSHPVDHAMSDTALVAALGDGAHMVEHQYVPVFDTVARRGEELDGASSAIQALTFPETPMEAADRYEYTLRAVQRASPYSLIVTHGFGVQAIAETCNGVEVIECDYCALTRLRRNRSNSEAGDEEDPTAALWYCDVLCRSTHTEALTPPEEAAREPSASAPEDTRAANGNGA